MKIKRRIKLPKLSKQYSGYTYLEPGRVLKQMVNVNINKNGPVKRFTKEECEALAKQYVQKNRK